VSMFEGWTSLHIFAQCGKPIEKVTKLIENGANIEATAIDSMLTALHLAAENPNPNIDFDFVVEIYANAFYFILTTITTVGYGDITGNTTPELLFSMIVEFVGLTFFSFLTGTISVMFSGDQSFESLINARMEQLDLWLLRLENCNKEEKIPNRLYHSIKEFI